MKPGAFAKYCLLPFGMGLVELSGLARPAAAQTAARPAAQDGGKTSDHPATEVTVVGKKSDGADRIDRHVYDIKSDPDAQAGVAADVLAKLPSVQVSVSGKVSLRGNANVTVLVDGKYPANGNAAIQTLSAADIDRIEVMTNPSAQYAPDGTGGIINIVTRKSHPLGVSGSLSGRADTLGGGNLAGSAVFTSGPWSIDSRLSLVHSLYSGRMRMAQDLPVAAARDSDWTGASDSGIANLNIGYKLDDVSTLTFEGQAYRQDALTLSRGAYGSPGLSYADAERLSYGFVQTDIEGVYDYDNDKTGTHFTLDADHTDFDSPLRQSETDTYAAGDAVYGNSARTWGPEDNIKADFEHGFVSGNQLTAGIEWDQRLTHVERTYSDSGSVPGPVPDGSHHSYMADQALASAYVTYQMTLGKWTLLPGLRGEWQRLSVSASGIDARTRALRLYPSLHLDRALGGSAKLKLSYSRRVQRPDINAYDPGASLLSRVAVRIGNPVLKPSETDSFEAAWSRARKDANYEAAVYYHATAGLQSDYSFVRSDGVIVTQPVNAGKSHAAGLELTVKGPLLTHWKYSLSSNLSRSEVPLIAGGTRAWLGYSANGTIEYDAPVRDGRGGDQYQLTATATGKVYTVQGYTAGVRRLDATWQHPLGRKLSLVVSAYDLTGSQRTTIVIDTPNLRSRTFQAPRLQSVRIALAYKFGGKK